MFWHRIHNINYNTNNNIKNHTNNNIKNHTNNNIKNHTNNNIKNHTNNNINNSNSNSIISDNMSLDVKGSNKRRNQRWWKASWFLESGPGWEGEFPSELDSTLHCFSFWKTCWCGAERWVPRGVMPRGVVV